jgi:hypothetical protein
VKGIKKVGLGMAAVVLLGILLLAGLSGDGFSLFGTSLYWSSESAKLKKLADQFLEDLQYKDFDKAAKYHTFEDQKTVDIPSLIERLFAVKPEVLNIDNIRIIKADFDDSGTRCRTFFRCDTEALNTRRKSKKEGGKNEIREVEGILYWHQGPSRLGKAPPKPKEGEEGKPADTTAAAPSADEPKEWFMQLESSLHR